MWLLYIHIINITIQSTNYRQRLVCNVNSKVTSYEIVPTFEAIPEADVSMSKSAVIMVYVSASSGQHGSLTVTASMDTRPTTGHFSPGSGYVLTI